MAEMSAPTSVAVGKSSGVDESSMFKQLNENVTTAAVTLGNVIQEVRSAVLNAHLNVLHSLSTVSAVQG